MTCTVGRYTTRNGRTAVVLCDDAPGLYPLIGYVISHYRKGAHPFTCAHPRSWRDDGRQYAKRPEIFDLIGPEGYEPEPPDAETVAARGEYAARLLDEAGRTP